MTSERIALFTMCISYAGIISTGGMLYYYGNRVISALRDGLQLPNNPVRLQQQGAIADRYRVLQMWMLFVLLGWILAAVASSCGYVLHQLCS